MTSRRTQLLEKWIGGAILLMGIVWFIFADHLRRTAPDTADLTSGHTYELNFHGTSVFVTQWQYYGYYSMPALWGLMGAFGAVTALTKRQHNYY
jgi:hypothetical protein